MSTESIIGQILSRLSNVSREEILEKLEEKKKKTGELISDETLLRMIAAELGLEITHDTDLAPTLLIQHLIPSLNDVTLVGRVVAVFPSRTFVGNKSGKIASLLIVDQSGILRVVLWNDKTSFIESNKIGVGQILRFSHGYTREDRSGKIELHIGERSEIEINPQDIKAKDYPTINKFTTKIKEITQTYRNKKVNIIGTVKELFSVSAFKRQDSSSGKVMRFVLADETGEISVVVWNERVDELEKILSKDVWLLIVNAKTKKALGKSLEIHVDAETYAEVREPEKEFLKIADLREGLNHVNVEGGVAAKPIFRDVRTSKGELVKLAVFELKDESGRVWVSAWRRHADWAKNLNAGDKIIVKDAYVKKGFSDQLELSTKNVTTLAKTENNHEN